MNQNLLDIQNQLFDNIDNLEVILAQGGSIPEAHINDGDHLLVDVTRKAEGYSAGIQDRDGAALALDKITARFPFIEVAPLLL